MMMILTHRRLTGDELSSVESIEMKLK